MSTVRTVRSMRSLRSLKQGIHSSSTAPNPSHLLSTQVDKARTQFTTMTVNSLKQECRQRGLKLSGRKSDLIERIVGFEQSKSFSSTSSASMVTDKLQSLDLKEPPMTKQAAARTFTTSAAAANPEKLVDYEIPNPPKPVEKTQPITKIPVGPHKDSSKPVYSDLSTKPVNADTGVSAGDVHVVDSGSTEVSTMNVDLGDGSPQHDEEKTGYKPNYEIPAKDKSFLLAVGAAIAVWWGALYMGKSEKPEEEQHKH